MAGWALDGRDSGRFDIPLIALTDRSTSCGRALLGALVAGATRCDRRVPRPTRLGGVFLAIWSLAVAFFCSLVLFAYEPIGHGQLGWTFRTPSLDLPGLNSACTTS